MKVLSVQYGVVMIGSDLLRNALIVSIRGFGDLHKSATHLSGHYEKVESLYEGQTIRTLTLSWAWLASDIQHTCEIETTAVISFICVTSQCEFQNIARTIHILLDVRCVYVRRYHCTQSKADVIALSLCHTRPRGRASLNPTPTTNIQSAKSHCPPEPEKPPRTLELISLKVMTWSWFILARIDLTCRTFVMQDRRN